MPLVTLGFNPVCCLFLRERFNFPRRLPQLRGSLRRRVIKRRNLLIGRIGINTGQAA